MLCIIDTVELLPRLHTIMLPFARINSVCLCSCGLQGVAACFLTLQAVAKRNSAFLTH